MNAFTPRTDSLLALLPNTMTDDDLAAMTLVLADQAGLTGPALHELEAALVKIREAREDRAQFWRDVTDEKAIERQ